MNAFAVLLLIVSAIVAFSSAFPAVENSNLDGIEITEDKETGDLDVISPEEIIDTDVVKYRFRRATCDLLSVSTPWGSLNHSACAAHCLTLRKGFKGGRCKSGVCHCRK